MLEIPRFMIYFVCGITFQVAFLNFKTGPKNAEAIKVVVVKSREKRRTYPRADAPDGDGDRLPNSFSFVLYVWNYMNVLISLSGPLAAA